MPTKKFVEAALAIRRQSPAYLWEDICQVLCSCAESATCRQVISKLRTSANSDLAFLIESLVTEHEKNMTWREIGLCLSSIGKAQCLLIDDGAPEVIWSGPSTEIIPVRRIDQILYDLIGNARQHILLVTFAAAKIGPLSESLLAATERGVAIDLVLETEIDSEGQLSFDAKSAFPVNLVGRARIFCWPISKRERNEWGKPGKLHAKCAVIDEAAIISSANLTGDAFNRNMELGILFRGGGVPRKIMEHFTSLIASGTLSLSA